MLLDETARRVLFVNRAFEDVWHSPIAALHPDAFEALLPIVHCEDRERVRQSWTAPQANEGWDLEYRIVRPDGSSRWLRDRAFSLRAPPPQPMRYARVIRDETDTQPARGDGASAKLELALREAHEHYAMVAENTTDLILKISVEGFVHYASPSCSGLLGCEPRELVGAMWFDRLHPDDVPRVMNHFHEIAAGAGDIRPHTFRVLREPGRYIWFESRARAMFGEDGHVRAILEAARDITERRRAQDRERTLQSELAHVARLSTMGEMASGLAHELNQPLASIHNYVAGCIRRLEEPELDRIALTAAMREVASEACRAGQIIHRMRDFVRRKAPHLSTLQLNEVINEVLSLLTSEIRLLRVTIQLDLQPDLPAILGDRVQLAQVVMNLVRNGLDALEESQATERSVRLCTRQCGASQVELSVQDTGQGICPEVAANLFEPFYTTRENGMGLGLAISRGIIEAHGGTIWLELNRQQGADFRFTLPFEGGKQDT